MFIVCVNKIVRVEFMSVFHLAKFISHAEENVNINRPFCCCCYKTD